MTVSHHISWASTDSVSSLHGLVFPLITSSPCTEHRAPHSPSHVPIFSLHSFQGTRPPPQSSDGISSLVFHLPYGAPCSYLSHLPVSFLFFQNEFDSFINYHTQLQSIRMFCQNCSVCWYVFLDSPHMFCLLLGKPSAPPHSYFTSSLMK